MQISDTTHRQTWNVTDQDTLSLGHSYRQSANGRGLIHDQQNGALAGHSLDDGTEVCLVLGQCLVEDFLTVAVDGNCVMIALADINTDKNVDEFDEFMVLDQRKPPRNSVL